MKIRFLLPLFVCILCFGKAYTQNIENNSQNPATVDIKIPVKFIDTGNEKYDNKVFTRDNIKHLRENYNLPAYQDNGNKDIDISNFNKEIAEWHKEYPEFDEILPFRKFSEFWLYDETCYPKAPELTEKNANSYDILFEKWMNKHPEGPAPIGNTSKSSEKHEKQKKEFYDKYYKQ
jgi:hypothetical protein